MYALKKTTAAVETLGGYFLLYYNEITHKNLGLWSGISGRYLYFVCILAQRLGYA